jgi:gamma-glutamyltranspeptidase/glutathione hydrolase/leukotriene-C4 hydrolase
MCSDIGVDTLRLGGNAVDAAVATTFCIGVVNCFASGIGGGGFMTVRIPKDNGSEVFTIDFRETAPAASNATMFVKKPSSAVHGGLSVAVPGEIRGLLEAHRRWGSLPWSQLVTPSADLARGWKVHIELARRMETYAELMLQNPDWSAIFAPQGRLLKEGEIIRRENYSSTLDTIAETPEAFYEGPIADALVAKITSTGGILTHEDLKRYEVIVKKPLVETYRNKTVYTTQAPTSGPVLLHMLNLMEQFDLSDGKSALNVHRFVETIKFGFAARTRLCDPAFLNDTSRILEIPTKDFAQCIRVNITDVRLLAS